MYTDRKWGLGKPRSRQLEDRFWEKVDKTDLDGHWLWKAALTGTGYGAFNTTDRKQERAHRVAFELCVGPIGPGLFVDHACRRRDCVNPAHLRLATNKQNQENLPRSSQLTGIRGAGLIKRLGRYQARVRHNGKLLHLGYFDTLEEAGEVARLKRLELYTHNDPDREV